MNSKDSNTVRVFCAFMLFSPFTVKVLVRLEFVFILLLTVSSKQKKRGLTKQPVYMISATMVIAHTCDHVFFKAKKVNWFDTLTVKQWEIMINNDVLLFLRPMRKHLTSSS